jgi:hypothetical protein
VRRSRVAFALGVVVPLLMLGGCSDDPEPKFAPTETASPSDTGSPMSTPTGPVEPTMPHAAAKNTESGAEAFVRFWIDSVNFAQATGETAPLTALNDVRCTGCRGIVEAINKPYGHGGRIEGGDLSIGKLRQLPLDYGADWAAFANGESQAQSVTDHGKTREHPGGRFLFYAYTTWTDDGWRMRWLRTPTPAA